MFAVCNHGDVSKNVLGSPVPKFYNKIAMNVATHVAHEVPIFVVYGKYVAPPVKSLS